MLKDELAKINITDDKPFLNSGVILYCPDNNIFYRITFGFGDNIDSLCDGCDDYMDISMDTYNDEGFFI